MRLLDEKAEERAPLARALEEAQQAIDDNREAYEAETAIYDYHQGLSQLAEDDADRLDPDTGADLYDNDEHMRAE